MGGTRRLVRSGGFRLVTPLALVALAGCAPAEKAADAGAETGGPRYESPELGIAIAAVPAGFEVEGVENGVLVLRHESGAALQMSTAAPEAGGVNLVEAIQNHKADILARDGGDYQGQRELMTAMLGTAYFSRGRFQGEGGLEEESAIFLLHPTGDRMLTVLYRYPAGDDSPVRVQDQLFAVVAELEPFGTPAEAPGDGDAAPDAG